MGNLGKATSFVDPEGDGDVMPKLVDMLTKVKELNAFLCWFHVQGLSNGHP